MDAWLALQRGAGNRAVTRLARAIGGTPDESRVARRILARGPPTKVKGGVETKVVSPAVRKLLDDKQIPFAREVTFELLDAGGKPVLRGRFDVVFRTPDTKELVFPELKGDKLDALTKGQKVYVPLFESEAGARVRIISSKGGKLYLPKDHQEQVHGRNFLRVGSQNLVQFTAHVEQMTTGKRATNVYYGPEGLRAFTDQKEFEKFLESKGIPTRKPPKPNTPPADKPLKPPKPNPDQRHPLHDPPTRKPTDTPVKGPIEATKAPPPTEKPQAPPPSSPERVHETAKKRAQGSTRVDQTSGGRSRVSVRTGNQGPSMGKSGGPRRQAAGVLIQGAVNWSGDKALNHAVASQMLALWPKIEGWRTQHPDHMIVFEVWLQEWDVRSEAGTARMVHEINAYHGATVEDVERQIAQAGRLTAPPRGWHLVGPYMGWIEPHQDLDELKEQAENKTCFIATACCGSSDAPEVIVLRRFRDRKLAPHRVGRVLMGVYYRVSPAPARAIAGRPRLRRAVRRGLVLPAASAAGRALERSA